MTKKLQMCVKLCPDIVDWMRSTGDGVTLAIEKALLKTDMPAHLRNSLRKAVKKKEDAKNGKGS